MKIRKLSVYEDVSNRPYILLKGKWLQKLEFNFHNFVEVKTYKDKIIIRKTKRPEEIILQVFLFLYPACLIEHLSEVLNFIIPFN